MANEVKGPILGTVLLAGVNSAGQPARIDQSALVAGMGSDGTPRWLLVDSSGNVISTGSSVELSDDAPADVGTATAGSGTEASRDDHVHAIPDLHITSRMVNLTVQSADVATAQTTTSTSYADLTTPGPAITLSPGIVQDHLIIHSAESFVSTGGAGTAYSGISIAGAAAADIDSSWHFNAAVANSASKVGVPVLAAAQASGAVHTKKYRTSANTSSFSSRRITGVALS